MTTENKVLIFITSILILPLLFYIFYQLGKEEQRKIGSRIDKVYIENIKVESRNKTLKEVQSFLKSKGIDLILDDKKNDLTNK